MVSSLDDARRRSHAGSPGRVPPHNLQAEESLLGAMLLSRDAIAAAVETCSADDFYKPAHGHVFDAVCSLYAQGEPSDPVTVADELRRAGLLDAIGGPAMLITLQANTPATTNAGRYARIVEEHALLRRLIGVAGEIAEMGYLVPEDVAAAVDRAETLVFEVAERRVTDSLRPLHDLLSESLDRLEALYDRGESITGVPTGFLDLDERLSGLQPSSLIIVGARPSMGKALSLDTRLPTPTGWTTMGDVRVGHAVLDDRGVPCSVTYATPVMFERPCYRLTFDDGSCLVADADHQWSAYDQAADQSSRRRRPCVVTTQQMVDEGVRTGNDQRPNWHLPLADPLELPEQDLPLDPYLLGVWLGDGTSAAAAVATTDREIVAALHVPEPSCIAALRDLDVRGDKHIPQPYLRASRDQRHALLQGLMDTDATVVDANGTVELCLSDPLLLAQARELVCSLGHKAGRIRIRTIQHAGRTDVAWRLAWNPVDEVFRLRRNGRHTRRAIISIEPCPSVPVRCITVDAPNHLYLAGDSMIPTHNTAIALGMAAHAAMVARTPVLFFSLEMSHSEVTQRLLCSEGRVNSTRIRNGKLHESDWPKISHAIGRLGEAPLYIDDNPNLTVMEIRAKARRLRSRLGALGLIVVDYLQLMSGRHNAENRQVEVSEISRSLKILARELEVPVVALSQLSRNLEMRADKRPVLADLRESGCMPADTRLQRADTGTEITLGELVASGARDVPVWSLDDSGRLVPRRLTHAFASGVKPVFRLRLASGRSVEATANHRFRTVDGWQALGDLDLGDPLAVPRRIPAPEAPVPMDQDEIVLLAHLLGDGCVLPRRPTHYPSADPDNLAAVETPARRFGPGRAPIPWQVRKPITAAMRSAGVTQRELAARLGEDYCGLYLHASKSRPRSMRRYHSRRIAQRVSNPWLDDLSTSDVAWDHVVSIDPLGEKPVFDATVLGTHNFIANGIVAHNSLEQDADVVMFLYRDEVYNAESQDRGSAEIIISKHRNGPTGITRLAFIGDYTRFENMARV